MNHVHALNDTNEYMSNAFNAFALREMQDEIDW